MEEVQGRQDACLNLGTVGVTPLVGDAEGTKAKTCGRNAAEGARVLSGSEGAVLDQSGGYTGLLPEEQERRLFQVVRN